MDIFDLHCDTLYRAVTEDISLDCPAAEVQLNRDADSRRLQCYAIWIPDSCSGEEAERLFDAAFERLKAECKICRIHLLQRGESPRGQFFRNKNTACFTVENAAALNGKLQNIQRFAECGVRMMTLTWNGANCVGDGADVEDAKGLTPFGKNALREMERCGIAVDISHASQKLFYDIAENAERPFAASHSNSFTVTPHRRNLTDEQFRIIAERGGIVGINFHNAFLNRVPERASVGDIFRHIEHFLSLGGENTLCFGSDFDGGTLPKDIRNSHIYYKIYEKMLQENYKEALIQNIFFNNALYLFENFDNRQNVV